MSKKIVAYFRAGGTTGRIAVIVQATEGRIK